MLAVLDTNVLVSALLFRGTASGIHRLILEGSIHPLISPAILDEYTRVLACSKFRLKTSDSQYLIEEEISPWFELRMIPETDDKFIQLALSEPSAILVSGDHHILDSRENLPCKVLTIQECLDFFQEH